MKKTALFAILILLIALIWGSKNPDVVQKYTGNFSKIVGETLLRWSSQALPDEAMPALEPIPAGTYILRERVLLPVAIGGGFLEVGTSVQKIGEGNGKFVVSDGIRQTVVDQSKLTSDAYEARALKKAGAEASAAIVRDSHKTVLTRIHEIESKLAVTRSELTTVENDEALAKLRGSGAPFGTSSAFLRNSITRLEAQKKELETKVNASR